MFLDYLKDNPDSRLYFNLNALQQDKTNCYTFATEFINGFCDTIRDMKKKNEEIDIQDAFNQYLTNFFPVNLPENRQVFHEGAIDVLESVIFTNNLDSDWVDERRVVLPFSMMKTSQLNSLFTSKARRISDIPFSEITNGEENLQDCFDENTETVSVRAKNGDVKNIQVNRFIYNKRKEQESLLFL